MCGIAGIVNPGGGVSTVLLKQVTDAVAHRGPDGEGFWVNSDGTVGFGHRRLAIIDLSDDGRQPLHCMDGRYTLTFNGEIYNYIEIRSDLEAKGYSFKSSSDTEVLLALYHDKQEECLGDLDGMFAFAIWDAKEEKLFCARDRFGEKPFYYAVHEGGLYFASEMKALWAAGVPRSIDHRLVFNYLEHGATFDPDDGSATFFCGIQKLPASHFFVVTPERPVPEPVRYWDLDYTRINSAINEDSAVEKVRELVVRSVERRLRSDVRVGSSLSGGLDSSVVVYVIDE
jgi:asparagine synthase (glutamine-hydrolysing)